MNKVTLHVKDGIVKKLTLSEEVTGTELLDIAFQMLTITVRSILNQRAASEGYSDLKSREDRGAIYDTLVEYISGLANSVFPENQDLKGDPEDFLAYLDKKVEETKKNENERSI